MIQFQPIFSVEDYDGTDGTNNSVDEDTGTATVFFFDVFLAMGQEFFSSEPGKKRNSPALSCVLCFKMFSK